MTFNHLKTNVSKLAHYRLKIRKVNEFFDFMQHPLCNLLKWFWWLEVDGEWWMVGGWDILTYSYIVLYLSNLLESNSVFVSASSFWLITSNLFSVKKLQNLAVFLRYLPSFQASELTKKSAECKYQIHLYTSRWKCSPVLIPTTTIGCFTWNSFCKLKEKPCTVL